MCYVSLFWCLFSPPFVHGFIAQTPPEQSADSVIPHENDVCINEFDIEYDFRIGICIWMLIVSVMNFLKQIIYPRFIEYLRQKHEAQENIKNEIVQEILQKNRIMIEELNKIVRPFFAGTPIALNKPGQFYWRMPTEPLPFKLFALFDYEMSYSIPVPVSLVSNRILQILSQIPSLHLKKQSDGQITLIDFDDQIPFQPELLQEEVASIKKAVYQMMIATQEYRACELQRIQKECLVNNKKLLFLIIEQIEKHRQIEIIQQSYLMQTNELLNKLSGMQDNKRFNAARISMQNALKFESETNELIQLQLATEKLNVLFQQQRMSESSLNDAKLLQRQYQTVINQKKVIPGDVREKLKSLFSNLESAIDYLQKDKKPVVEPGLSHQQMNEERRRQREEAAKFAAEELRRQKQEKLQHKLEFQRQAELEKQRRQKELDEKREREMRIEKRKQEEAMLRQQSRAVSVTSSCSSVQPQNLREKIILIGDLLQRFSTANSDHKTPSFLIEIKFALLSQMLRLFQLADHYITLKVTASYRNAFMHQHRFISLELLVEFAKSIAYQPNQEKSEHENKLEDILNLLALNETNELKQKLKLSLLALSITDFYQACIQPELMKPTVRNYCETLDFLFKDLHCLHSKEAFDLANYPDKVLATVGILTCIGECYQQLSRLGALGSPLLETFENGRLKEFLYNALKVREKMGHAVYEEETDIARLKNQVKHVGFFTHTPMCVLVEHDSTTEIQHPATHTTPYTQ